LVDNLFQFGNQSGDQFVLALDLLVKIINHIGLGVYSHWTSGRQLSLRRVEASRPGEWHLAIVRKPDQVCTTIA
jgi:hypothetical protein